MFNLAELEHPIKILLYAVAFYIVCKGLKDLLHESLVNILLRYLQAFLDELRGKKGLAGRINAHGVVGLILILIMSIIFEIGPSVVEKLFGKSPSTTQFPYFSFCVLIMLGLVFFISVYIINKSEQEIALWKKLQDTSKE